MHLINAINRLTQCSTSANNRHKPVKAIPHKPLHFSNYNLYPCLSFSILQCFTSKYSHLATTIFIMKNLSYFYFLKIIPQNLNCVIHTFRITQPMLMFSVEIIPHQLTINVAATDSKYTALCFYVKIYWYYISKYSSPVLLFYLC
jgi:hypothetical protein